MQPNEFFDETERPGQPFPTDTHMIIRDRYELAAKLARGRRVVEVGCGAGFGLRHIASVAESLQAVEYSSENIDLLSSNFGPAPPVVRADAHLMPFKSGHFDLVIALAMIYYLDMDRFLAEAKRVLSNEGVLFFCTSNKDVPGFCAAPYTTEYFSVPELKRALENAGFESKMLGAFPSVGSLAWRKVRARFKSAIKFIFTKVPGGRLIWRSLRQRSLVDVHPLPKCFTEMMPPLSAHVALDMDKLDQTHRVIYVIATKRSS